MTRRGILTGGTWCIDRNILLDNWPQVNGRAEILRADMSGGGSGCNMAIDIRKLDPSLPVATIALVGDDMEGQFLRALADKHGIDRAMMHVSSEAQTDYTFAFSALPSGQRTHISYFGTSHLLTPDHFDFAGLTTSHLPSRAAGHSQHHGCALERRCERLGDDPEKGESRRLRDEYGTR